MTFLLEDDPAKPEQPDFDDAELFKDVYGAGPDVRQLLELHGFEYEKQSDEYEKWVKRQTQVIYVISHIFPLGMDQWEAFIYTREGGKSIYHWTTSNERLMPVFLEWLLSLPDNLTATKEIIRTRSWQSPRKNPGLPESVCEASEDEIEDFKDVYAAEPEPEPTYSLAEIKAAVPLFFDRKTMRFHGTRKVYQYGNYIVVHNVKRMGGHENRFIDWTVNYVVYKFEKTPESPEGDLRYLATTKELSNAKRMIKLRDFRSEREKQAWGDVGMEEAVQPLTLLHGTSTVHLPKIKRFGLVNACLTNNPTVANYYAQETSDEDGGQPVVLSVSIRDPKILKPDYPSFEEPLTFTYRRYASSEEEFHQMLDKGKQGIHWPADENDWKTSLRVAEAVIASYVPAKDLHPQAVHEANDKGLTESELLSFEQLPDFCQEALLDRMDAHDLPSVPRLKCRLERHSIDELLNVFRRWGWLKNVPSNSPADIHSYIRRFGEKRRFDTIRRTLDEGKPLWPYISDFAKDWNKFIKGEDTHGDGFHRVLVAAERGIESMLVLYPLD